MHVAFTYRAHVEDRLRDLGNDPPALERLVGTLAESGVTEETRELVRSLLLLLGYEHNFASQIFCYVLIVLGGRHDLFIRLLEASREPFPEPQARDFALGLLYRRVNKNKAALASYERYLERYPDQRHVLYDASYAALALNDAKKARWYLERAREAVPYYLAATIRLTSLERLTPRQAQALTSDEYELLADRARQEGSWKRALCYLSVALSLRPGIGADSIEAKIREIVSAQGKTWLFISPLMDHALGHLAVHTDYVVRSNRADNADALHLLVATEQPANQTLIDLYARAAPLVQDDELYFLLAELAPTWIRRDVTRNPREWELYQRSEPAVAFSDEESAHGWARLERWGIRRGRDWFACIYARDADFWHDLSKGEFTYRNADIGTFDLAVQSILDRGGYVVRIGSWAETPVGNRDPRVIDYSFEGTSGFLDMFLLSQARFVVGTQSGLTDACVVFDTPYVAVNCAPMKTKIYGKNTLWIFKKFWSRQLGRYITFTEFDGLTSDMTTANKNAAQLWTASGINRAGFDLHDNTPEEIRDVTEEMMARLIDGRWAEFEDDEALQRYYALMGTIAFMDGARTPVGRRFLEANTSIFA